MAKTRFNALDNQMTADRQTLLEKALELDHRLNDLYGEKTPHSRWETHRCIGQYNT